MNASRDLPVKTQVLLTGATGYIGGSVLLRLSLHPLSYTFHVTILVRDPSKAAQFRSLGIHAVDGSYSDLKLVQDLAAEADIVIACANADDGNAANAILRGLKERHEKTGKVPSLIHTSGTGVLVDDARGMFATETIYSDLNISQLESLPITQPHRPVDVSLINADKKGYVKTYIIAPSTIHGIATGWFVDLGLQHPQSIQIPQLIKLSLDRGRAGMVGEGKNIWPNVHIVDVTDLYILLFDLVLPPPGDLDGQSSRRTTNPHFGHGAAGFYFGENGEHTLYSVGEAIGKAMVDLGNGKYKHSTPTTFTDDEYRKFFPNGTGLGGNSRCRADRGRAIGWKPRKTTKDMLDSVKDEFLVLVP